MRSAKLNAYIAFRSLDQVLLLWHRPDLARECATGSDRTRQSI